MPSRSWTDPQYTVQLPAALARRINDATAALYPEEALSARIERLIVLGLESLLATQATAPRRPAHAEPPAATAPPEPAARLATEKLLLARLRSMSDEAAAETAGTARSASTATSQPPPAQEPSTPRQSHGQDESTWEVPL